MSDKSISGQVISEQWISEQAAGRAPLLLVAILLAVFWLTGCGGPKETPPPGEAVLPTPHGQRAPGFYANIMDGEPKLVLDQIACSGLEIGDDFLLEASSSAGYGEVRLNVFHDGYGVYENAEVEVLFGPADEPHLKGRTSIATVEINEDGSGAFVDVVILSTAVNSSYNKEFTVTAEWVCP